MHSVPHPKAMARALRAAMAARGVALTHGEALEVVVAQHGLPGWNVLAARGGPEEPSGGAARVRLGPACPVLRIFNEAAARTFYLDHLGFALDWEHRFEPGMPLYAAVSRSGLTLHLSGHHGDASPGATAFVRMAGVEALHAELAAKRHPGSRPGIERTPWGRMLEVVDPFGNRLRLCEEDEAA